MKILLSGASGLIGSALRPHLEKKQHEVICLTRSRAQKNKTYWNPLSGEVDTSSLEGIEVVIHLAGEPLDDQRWSRNKKKLIEDSRVKGTRILCEKLAALSSPPKLMICASAVGYYGDRGSKVLAEEDSAGSGFLAQVCQGWEDACQVLRQKGIRVINLRLGVVLHPTKGALGKTFTLSRMGMGGVLGDGKQYISWISIDDVVGAIEHLMLSENIEGPINIASPFPVTQYDFAHTLGRVIGRRPKMRVPLFTIRLTFGEMADELMLASTSLSAQRLLSTGYTFQYSHLEEALLHLLKK